MIERPLLGTRYLKALIHGMPIGRRMGAAADGVGQPTVAWKQHGCWRRPAVHWREMMRCRGERMPPTYA